MQVLHAFVIVCTSSIAFILVQMYLARFITSEIVLRDILAIFSQQGIRLVLVDKLALEAISRKNPPGLNLHFLSSQVVTTFATIANLKSPPDLENSLSDLQEVGFRVDILTGPGIILDVRHAHANANIPLHIVAERTGWWLHVVILYDIHGSFLWHGPATGVTTLGFPEDMLQYGSGGREGVLDWFDVRSSKLDDLEIEVPANTSEFLAETANSTFISCNYTRAKEFFDTYNDDTSGEALYFKAKVLQIIRLSKLVLESLEVPFWLSSGTCLGWFRQCDVIPYSKDVDIGVWIKHYHPGIIDAFVAKGFWLHSIFGRVNDSYELSFGYSGVKLDIFFFYEDSRGMWNGGTEFTSGQKYRYDFPKFQLCWTELMGIKVRVPCDTLSYIEANYGDQWFEPIKEWDWNKSPPNARTNGYWPELEWREVIQIFYPEAEDS
ncbi:PREDICTED: fukutin-like isoform X3 [Priapulus caudatus]|uniref:Fukutin-like isoform X3 n=1 Tax=Priapulus caudatus TaxID=37621 RepID=A0ABM1E938_PRICU|nr:PREDICTED: fukutin-like isoform X3 [Priapulus caudatus]